MPNSLTKNYKIFKTITNFTKNYNDPESNLPFDENNTKIQIVEKNGNVTYNPK